MNTSTISNKCLFCSEGLLFIRDFYTVISDGLEKRSAEYDAIFEFIKREKSNPVDDWKYLTQLFLTKPASKAHQNDVIEDDAQYIDTCTYYLREILQILYELYKYDINCNYINEMSRKCNPLLRDIARALDKNTGSTNEDDLMKWWKSIEDFDAHEANDETYQTLKEEAKMAVENINNMIETYLYDEYEDLPYEDCSISQFRNFLNSERYALSYQAHGMDLANRIQHLQEPFQTIATLFVQRHLKHFGKMLSQIMEYKGITEQDIVNAYSGEQKHPLKASHVQALKKCKSPSPDAFENGIVSAIARILFVDESLLLYGNGKSYGNWKDFIRMDLSDTGKKRTKKETKSIKKNNDKIVKNTVKEIAATKESFESYISTLDAPTDFPLFSSLKDQILLCTDISNIKNLVEILEQAQTKPPAL